MDISSGNVDFGVTCPGSLMQQLQRDVPEQVGKITKLQTSFSRNYITYMCPLPCKDLTTVSDFIKSISALQELSVLNYEPDISSLWPAIFQQAQSLRSVAIHTPPQNQANIWTAAAITELSDRLPQLKSLEIDLSLDEAESRINGYSPPLAPAAETTQLAQIPSALSDLTKMDRLESLLINVNLGNAKCSFVGQHTWNAMGSTSFPPINKPTCEQLARQIFEEFYVKNPSSALRHLQVRFPRRQYDDRAQFYTLAYSIHVRKNETGVTVEAENWKQYLPEAPWDGLLGSLIREQHQARW